MKALPNSTCPLCGKPNGCLAAQEGHLDIDCWCRHAQINPDSIARIPDELRHKACLCRECAAKPPKP